MAQVYRYGISLFQVPARSKIGSRITLVSVKAKEKYVLPDNYTVVPAIVFNKNIARIAVPEPPNEIDAVFKVHRRDSVNKQELFAFGISSPEGLS